MMSIPVALVRLVPEKTSAELLTSASRRPIPCCLQICGQRLTLSHLHSLSTPRFSLIGKRSKRREADKKAEAVAEEEAVVMAEEEVVEEASVIAEEVAIAETAEVATAEIVDQEDHQEEENETTRIIDPVSSQELNPRPLKSL